MTTRQPVVLALATAAAGALFGPCSVHAQTERNEQLNCFYAARAEEPAKARSCLQSLLASSPSDTTAWLELGYFELALNDNEAALEAFSKAIALDPGNEQARMQTAYLLDTLDRKRQAVQVFNGLARSAADPARRAQACRAAEVLAPLAARRVPRPYFVEVYTAPDYYSHIETATFPFEMRAGVSPGATGRAEFYGHTRILTDSRSTVTTGEPEVYFDNFLTIGAGMRIRPFARVGLVLLTEVGRAYDLIEQDRERWRGDARAGAIYYSAWGTRSACPAALSAPWRPVLDVYGEALYFSRYDDNVISTLRVRPGLRVLEAATMSLDAQLHAFGMVDTNREDFNNFVEFGPGAAFTPDRRRAIRVGWETVWRHFRDGRHDVVTRVRIEYGIRL